MSKIKAWIAGEPAVVTALVGALVALVASLGLDLSADQRTALTTVLLAVVGLVTRSQVTPTPDKES